MALLNLGSQNVKADGANLIAQGVGTYSDSSGTGLDTHEVVAAFLITAGTAPVQHRTALTTADGTLPSGPTGNTQSALGSSFPNGPAVVGPHQTRLDLHVTLTAAANSSVALTLYTWNSRQQVWFPLDTINPTVAAGQYVPGSGSTAGMGQVYTYTNLTPGQYVLALASITGTITSVTVDTVVS